MRILALGLILTGCVATATPDVGANYLGAKYVSDPLGEGVVPDADPLIRDDAFDCVTFVETSLADGDITKLNKIRYKNGEIDFLTRNHFIETDWLANNADIVSDVTSEYCKTARRHVVIDKQNWLRVTHGITAQFAPQIADLDYIPYYAMCDINNRVPLIVLFITGNPKNYDKIGTDLAVSHMGFLMPGGRVLRHASSEYGRVIDVNFREYLTARAKNKNNIGIMLVEIK